MAIILMLLAIVVIEISDYFAGREPCIVWRWARIYCWPVLKTTSGVLWAVLKTAINVLWTADDQIIAWLQKPVQPTIGNVQEEALKCILKMQNNLAHLRKNERELRLDYDLILGKLRVVHDRLRLSVLNNDSDEVQTRHAEHSHKLQKDLKTNMANIAHVQDMQKAIEAKIHDLQEMVNRLKVAKAEAKVACCIGRL